MLEIVKGYISLIVSDESSKVIKKFLKDKGLDSNIDVLHSTIIHDAEINYNPVNEDYIKGLTKGKLIYGQIKGGDILGDREKGHRSPVILIDSPVAEKIHEHLIDCGYHHKFDDYIVHISVNYDLPEDELDKYLSVINEMSGMTIDYDRIEVDIIKPKEEV